MKKLNFKNDYSNIAHRLVLERLKEYMDTSFNGYGLDEASEKAKRTVKDLIQTEADIHFLIGGTSANKIAIAHALRPYEAVIAVESGHIAVHETGAIEQSGHKILTVKPVMGKITPKDIQNTVDAHYDEHGVVPRLVYISNATEIGTIYTKDELTKIAKVCKENNLYFYIDGARLSNALVAQNNDLTLPEIASLTDMFTIGGTKNGLLMGEVLIVTNPELKPFVRHSIKQNGGMLAKGFLLGLQFQVFFEDNLFLKLASHANNLALKLQEKLIAMGYELAGVSETNQLFVNISFAKYDYLKDLCAFEVWNKTKDKVTVRFVTSFATKEEDVDKLLELLKK